jgi:plastocyanin
MTAADKFGIAFAIGFTAALIGIAMSLAGMGAAPSPAPAVSIPPPPPAPMEEEMPAMEEEMPAMEEEMVEEEMPAMEEEMPAMEEEMVEEEMPAMEEPMMEEEMEAAPMSADVSIPTGSSVPGCEETSECYIPAEVTVGVGGTVTWSNDDTAAHTVTSGTPTDGPDGAFDSSIIMAGASFENTFDEAGEYDYFCIVHPWMTGKVNVE